MGMGHQPDMCADTCAAQHQWFYVRVCPDRSQTIKPGLKRKRRLDLKMDLSRSNCCGSLQELLTISAAQLEVQLHTVTCSYALFTCSYTLLHAVAHCHTQLHNVTCSSTLLHAVPRCYMHLHPLMLPRYPVGV